MTIIAWDGNELVCDSLAQHVRPADASLVYQSRNYQKIHTFDNASIHNEPISAIGFAGDARMMLAFSEKDSNVTIEELKVFSKLLGIHAHATIITLTKRIELLLDFGHATYLVFPRETKSAVGFIPHGFIWKNHDARTIVGSVIVADKYSKLVAGPMQVWTTGEKSIKLMSPVSNRIIQACINKAKLHR